MNYQVHNGQLIAFKQKLIAIGVHEGNKCTKGLAFDFTLKGDTLRLHLFDRGLNVIGYKDHRRLQLRPIGHGSPGIEYKACLDIGWRNFDPIALWPHWFISLDLKTDLTRPKIQS